MLTVVIWVFALISAGALLSLLTTRNLIRAAFAFLIILFSVAALMMTRGGGFAGTVQIIIYVGGILLLLLFGIMLTHRKGESFPVVQSVNRLTGTGMAFLILSGCFFLLKDQKWKTVATLVEPPATGTPVQQIGLLLLTDQLILFELISVLLLLAAVGAVYLAQTQNQK